ncbi:hypothetical protein I7I50_07832 [Histoplasma capsulatum G186AR]|uniref:Secreted protein n=1 Tax=Ajellomyces capsulatus TaxID=5037 RepID=A0A8H7YK12_AJECA|nr:hypothetical protein I7I52_08348 [Histoplasma capsulatum]QSS68423.1 hypothetical protein I7I50_07832 [Histoplasma capsulatum G186AR]
MSACFPLILFFHQVASRDTLPHASRETEWIECLSPSRGWCRGMKCLTSEQAISTFSAAYPPLQNTKLNKASPTKIGKGEGNGRRKENQHS